MKSVKFLFAAMLVLGGAVTMRAEDSGSNVVVIYNTRVPESKSVADYYAERRHVPAGQVFGFALTTKEEMSRVEFRDALQKPLAKLLEDKKLWRIGSETIPATNGAPRRTVRKVTESKIRYAVLCYGVPTHVLEDDGIKEKIADATHPELSRNEAAVDSELAMLPGIEQNLPLNGPLPNPFFGVTNAAFFHPTNGLLMVARLDGPNADIARGLVDKAIQAETDGLWGRSYFDLRGLSSPSYKMGDDWIRGAAEVCRHLGFETVVDENEGTFSEEFPMSQIAIYCGWYNENASGPFTRTNVEFMPGAFAYHLHSYSANPLRNTTNRWVGPLLYKGATATMGCVAEPYLMGTPNVSVFCSRFIFSGFSFGEAAYSSQNALSWQVTIVGDPLYRPFQKPPQQLQDELERKHSKLAEWSYLRLVNLNLEQGKRPGEMSDYVEGLALTKQSSVLTEKLAALYAAEGKPWSAVDTCEKALTLDPSPQQRVRLRLTIADLLAPLGRTKDAMADLRKLLDEDPDYPARFEVLKKVLNMAIATGDKDEITHSVHDMQKFGEDANKKAAEEEKKNH